MKWWDKLIEKILIKRYERVGAIYGDMLSYLDIAGKAFGFDRIEKKFLKLEHRVYRLGYIPHSADDLIAYGGGYVASLPELKVFSPKTVAEKDRDLKLYEMATFLRHSDKTLDALMLNGLNGGGRFPARPKSFMFLYVEAAKGLLELSEKLARHHLPPALKPIQRTPEEWVDFLMRKK